MESPRVDDWGGDRYAANTVCDPQPFGMRICPKCRRAFPRDETHCTDDGTPTVDGGEGALAMTAIGPGHVRDTPFTQPVLDVPEVDDRIGKTIGGVYRIKERIGTGGMGVVYLAEHVHIGRKFALKLLTAAVAQNPTAIDRLKQEAIAASKIEHDNIVQIVGFDRTAEGEVFIVMELLKGTDLAGLLDEHGSLPLERAVPIAIQICRAVGAAHAAGIIHRDLKPENVFVVDKAGRDFVKVLDFGISKVKDAEAEAVRMTKTGQLVGTPLYMSPEQARGEAEVDRRADVYSLGVILYEMLTGEPPFAGENYFQLLWKHTNELPVPPSQTRGGAHVHPALESAVLRTLSKDKETRWQSMEELENVLVAACPGIETPSLLLSPSRTHSIPTVPMVKAPGHRPTWIGWAIAAAVALVIGVGGWAAMQGQEATAQDDVGRSAAPTTAGLEPGTAAPTAAPAPATVLLRFEAEGDPIEVRAGGESLGTTPLDLNIARGDSATRYTFHRRGWMDGSADVVPDMDRTVPIALRPVPRKGGPGPVKRGGGAFPIKTDF